MTNNNTFVVNGNKFETAILNKNPVNINNIISTIDLTNLTLYVSFVTNKFFSISHTLHNTEALKYHLRCECLSEAQIKYQTNRPTFLLLP